MPEPRYIMPAEWHPHEATWIAWPHHEADWPGKLAAIDWVYAEIVRVLAPGERVEILCHDERIRDRARECLVRNHVDESGYRLHLCPTDRGWLRDSGASGVLQDGRLFWMHWRFNGWAKYDNYQQDQAVPEFMAQTAPCERFEPMRPSSRDRVVLEGGAIDTDGQGTLLTTEECLLSEVQQRNPGMTKTDYEKVFADYLGIEKTIWLGRGCQGDDTHGHVDDIARFVAPGKVVLAYEPNSDDENHAASVDNLRRLQEATDATGRPLEVIPLPMPEPVWFDGERLPASYANFYIGNKVVLVPTFNDPHDRKVLNILAPLFPDRQVVGIYARDLVWGFGTFHCLTQQQPAAATP